MLIVDRIEGKYAVCEKDDKTMVDIPVSQFLEKVSDGTCVELGRDGKYIVLHEETKRRELDVKERMSKLFK